MSVLKLRSGIIGCVAFSESMAKTLESCDVVEIAAIVTLGQSTFNADHVSLVSMGERLGAAVFDANNQISDEASDDMAIWLQVHDLDIIFCLGWPKLLPETVLHAAKQGVIGYHPSLLPANRGRHPIIWALALGLTETGSTFFRMDTGADSGDIVAQDKVPVRNNDTAADLYARLTETARKQIIKIAKHAHAGTLQVTPQNEGDANYWRKRSAADGLIDWRMSAGTIHNLVRALDRPYVGAHCDWQGQSWKVWAVTVHPDAASNAEPGKVLYVEDRDIVVKCSGGAVRLIDHEFDSLPNVGEYL